MMDIEKSRKICNAASPAPWIIGNGKSESYYLGRNTVLSQQRVVVDCATYGDDFDRQTYADIEFIAHAREALPRALNEIERLTARCELLEEQTANRAQCNRCRYKLQSDAWKYYTYPCSECKARTSNHFTPVEETNNDAK